MHDFFDRVARRYDRSFAPDARSSEDDLRPLLATCTPGATVLDLGCGTGRAWPTLLSAGLRVIALDASMAMLREARRRATVERVAVLRADLYARWPIADGCVDVVLALHAVLAHPPEDETRSLRAFQAFHDVGQEIARVASRGALVAIDLPEPTWAKRFLRPLGEDRYLHVEEGGAEIVAVIPEPTKVVDALGLPLSLSPCVTGTRASGRLGVDAGVRARSSTR